MHIPLVHLAAINYESSIYNGACYGLITHRGDSVYRAVRPGTVSVADILCTNNKDLHV